MRSITLFILLIGLGLFFYSLSMDYYKNNEAAEKLAAQSNNIDKTEYYKQEANLRTSKVLFMDLGAGISISATVLLIFLFSSGIRRVSDLYKLKSINKTKTFILSNLAWLILIPGTYFYYTYRGERGDYAPFADSVGIPIMAQISLILLLIVPLNLFLGLAVMKSSTPANIFIKIQHYTKRAIFWELFFGFWILVNLICFVSLVSDGDHFSIPVNMFFTYILLSLRAGQLSKWAKENKVVQ